MVDYNHANLGRRTDTNGFKRQIYAQAIKFNLSSYQSALNKKSRLK